MDVGRSPLQTGNAELTDFIHATIQKRGPLSFACFMEQALYHPEHGYYSSGRCAIGRAGDYFTSVSAGPLFGRLLAGQFEEMWQALGRPGNFVLMEQGAHDGRFAHDVLVAARLQHPEFFRALRYEIVEPFEILRRRQAAVLSEFGIVHWSNSISGLEPFCGVHFSNELIDAMPVHLLKWTGSEWRERHVAVEGGGCALIDLPVSNPEIQARLSAIPMPLPAGYETEINLATLRWIQALSAKLERGFVLVADYGYARDEFYAPQRVTGTLRCCARHRPVSSPLERIGHADITAHVDWTSLAERAQECGFALAGFTDQHHFITGLLARGMRQELALPENASALQTLLHPAHLGMKFQFLLLRKGTTAALAGLAFARDARTALGLR